MHSLVMITCKYVHEPYVGKTGSMCYPPVKTAPSIRFDTIPAVTDGQTDRNAVAKTVLSIAARCKKSKQLENSMNNRSRSGGITQTVGTYGDLFA